MSGLEVKATSRKCVQKEELKSNLNTAMKDAVDLSNADYDTLEDIADGLEKMLQSWNNVQDKRARDYARLKESLAKDNCQAHKGAAEMKEALQDIGIRISHDGKDETFVCPLKQGNEMRVVINTGNHKKDGEEDATRENDGNESRWLPEWAALLNKSGGEECMELSDRSSSKRKVGKNIFGVRAMPLKKKPRKQVVTVQFQNDKADKEGECTCDEGEKDPRNAAFTGNTQRKRWPSSRSNPLNSVKGKDSTGNLKKQVEELQIALLESATEYELKILQMKMQMLQNKNEPPKRLEDDNDVEVHAIDCTRKQLSRLQKEKRDLTLELHETRKRERTFEQQRKCLEDAQYRVNCLKRELMKKEGDLVNVQLREKAANARVYQFEEIIKKSESKFDLARLWSVLPEFRDWLQTLRKDGAGKLDPQHLLQMQHYEANINKLLEDLPNRPAEMEASVPFYKACTHALPQPGQRSEKLKKKPQQDKCVVKPKKEAQALQRELHKLAHNKPTHHQGTSSKHTRSAANHKQQEQQQQQLQLQQEQQPQQQHQPYWLYGAAMLLFGVLCRNRCMSGGA